MKSIINELWHGNIVPQEDSRNNTKEMKELIETLTNNQRLRGVTTRLPPFVLYYNNQSGTIEKITKI